MMLFFSFLKAFMVHLFAKVFGYEPLASKWVLEKRGRICEGCDFFQDGECGKCGCLVMAKVMLATEKCPVGKWGRVWLSKPRR